MPPDAGRQLDDGDDHDDDESSATAPPVTASEARPALQPRRRSLRASGATVAAMIVASTTGVTTTGAWPITNSATAADGDRGKEPPAPLGEAIHPAGHQAVRAGRLLGLERRDGGPAEGHGQCDDRDGREEAENAGNGRAGGQRDQDDRRMEVHRLAVHGGSDDVRDDGARRQDEEHQDHRRLERPPSPSATNSTASIETMPPRYGMKPPTNTRTASTSAPARRTARGRCRRPLPGWRRGPRSRGGSPRPAQPHPVRWRRSDRACGRSSAAASTPTPSGRPASMKNVRNSERTADARRRRRSRDASPASCSLIHARIVSAAATSWSATTGSTGTGRELGSQLVQAGHDGRDEARDPGDQRECQQDDDADDHDERGCGRRRGRLRPRPSAVDEARSPSVRTRQATISDTRTDAVTVPSRNATQIRTAASPAMTRSRQLIAPVRRSHAGTWVSGGFRCGHRAPLISPIRIGVRRQGMPYRGSPVASLRASACRLERRELRGRDRPRRQQQPGLVDLIGRGELAGTGLCTAPGGRQVHADAPGRAMT